jgi:hypothetical protein
MKNFKLNQVMVMNNGEWKQKHTSVTIPRMVTIGHNILNNHYYSEEYKSKREEMLENMDVDPKVTLLGDLIIPTTNIHKSAVSSVKSVISSYKFKELCNEPEPEPEPEPKPETETQAVPV